MKVTMNPRKSPIRLTEAKAGTCVAVDGTVYLVTDNRPSTRIMVVNLETGAAVEKGGATMCYVVEMAAAEVA